MINIFDKKIKEILTDKMTWLETHFDADVVFYYGEIRPTFEKVFRDFIEDLKDPANTKQKIVIILNTVGGSAETVEKMVEVIRFHYQEVYFIVPDYAMSAGTIWCMSGDKIYMDYSSSLGPIDPQILIGERYVPALGYLDKVNELIEKSRDNTITNAEFAILRGQDLAMLRSYEQAKDLTVSLLKTWLVRYKFQNWLTHRTDPTKIGQLVTPQEKEERAAEIANILGDNKTWHSHGRFIGINKLKTLLRLEIEDYSLDNNLRPVIREYNDLICEYIRSRGGSNLFLHSKKHF